MEEFPNNLTLSDLNEIAKYCPNPDYATALLEEKIKNNPNIDFWLEYFKKDNINKFCSQYNKVFADVFNWPYCYTIEDFYKLPEDIINECIEVHRFSPEFWIKDSGDPNFFNPTRFSIPHFLRYSEIPIKNIGYSMDQLNKAKYHILNYIDIFKNKKVLEIGACDGFFSALTVLNGAKHVTSTDVIPYHINLMNFTKDYLNLQEKMTIIHSDANDLEKTKQITSKNQVIFLNNLLITVPNKIEVLSSICQGNPEYIIISEPCSFNRKSEEESTYFENTKRPVIEYVLHKNIQKYTLLYVNYPCHKKYDEYIAHNRFSIGVPNQSWFDMVFNSFGYKLESTKKYKLENPDDTFITRVYKNCSI